MITLNKDHSAVSVAAREWDQHKKGQKVLDALHTATQCVKPPATALQELTQAQGETECINEGKHIKLQTIQSPHLPLSHRVLSSHPIPQVFGVGHCHRHGTGPNKPGAGAHRTNFVSSVWVPALQIWVNWDYWLSFFPLLCLSSPTHIIMPELS